MSEENKTITVETGENSNPTWLADRLERERRKAKEVAKQELLAELERQKKEEELKAREEALAKAEEEKKLAKLKKEFTEAGGNEEDFEIASKLFVEKDGKIDMELAVEKFPKTVDNGTINTAGKTLSKEKPKKEQKETNNGIWNHNIE